MWLLVQNYKKSLNIPKEEAVNLRRTDNTMAKRKRMAADYPLDIFKLS